MDFAKNIIGEQALGDIEKRGLEMKMKNSSVLLTIKEIQEIYKRCKTPEHKAYLLLLLNSFTPGTNK